MRTVGFTVALVAAHFAIPVTGVQAQGQGGEGEECGYVAWCEGWPVDNNHALMGTSVTPNYAGLHSECKICYHNGAPTSWKDCHELCEFTQDAAYEQAYRSLIDAASEGEVTKALFLAMSVPKHAIVNDERRSLQIRGCDGQTLIANLPLGEVNLALAQALHQRKASADYVVPMAPLPNH